MKMPSVQQEGFSARAMAWALNRVELPDITCECLCLQGLNARKPLPSLAALSLVQRGRKSQGASGIHEAAPPVRGDTKRGSGPAHRHHAGAGQTQLRGLRRNSAPFQQAQRRGQSRTRQPGAERHQLHHAARHLWRRAEGRGQVLGQQRASAAHTSRLAELRRHRVRSAHRSAQAGYPTGFAHRVEQRLRRLCRSGCAIRRLAPKPPFGLLFEPSLRSANSARS